MRRHLQPTAVDLSLSVEEEAILMDEQNNTLMEIDQTDNNIDRLVDTSAVADDTMSAIVSIQNVTPVEQALVDAVSEMAVAGTDTDPEQVISLGDGNVVATEGFAADFGEKLQKLWETIKKALLAAWEKIKSFFVGREKAISTAASAQVKNDNFIEEHKAAILLLGYEPSVIEMGYTPAEPKAPLALGHDPKQKAPLALGHDPKHDAATIAADKEAAEKASKADQEAKSAERKAKHEKAVKDLQSAFEHHNFKFKGNSSLISTISGVPKDFQKELTAVLHYSEQSHKDGAKILRDLCFGFDESVSHFQGDNMESGLTTFCAKFQKNFEVLMRSIGNTKNGDGGVYGRTKEALLGSFLIECFTKNTDGGSALEQAREVSGSTLEISAGSAKHNGDVSLINDTAQAAFGITIKRWLDFANSETVRNSEAELNNYTEKFVKHIDRLVKWQGSVKSHAEGGDAYKMIQAVIDMCRMLIKVVMTFTTRHIASALSIVRAAQQYQQESNAERVRMYQEAMK